MCDEEFLFGNIYAAAKINANNFLSDTLTEGSFFFLICIFSFSGSSTSCYIFDRTPLPKISDVATDDGRDLTSAYDNIKTLMREIEYESGLQAWILISTAQPAEPLKRVKGLGQPWDRGLLMSWSLC